MTKVAPTLGLSDVGLAKICREYEIPSPPVGYWALVIENLHRIGVNLTFSISKCCSGGYYDDKFWETENDEATDDPQFEPACFDSEPGLPSGDEQQLKDAAPQSIKSTGMAHDGSD